MTNKWNNNFWKNLDNLSKNKMDKLFRIMKEDTDYAVADLRETVPYLYGGLQLSVYGDVYRTEHGVTARLGIDNDKHINLRGSRSYTKLVYKASKNDTKEGSPDNWQYEERQHNSPLAKQDDITNRELANILLFRVTKTGSQKKMQDALDLVDDFKDIIRNDVREFLQNGGK